MKKFLSAIAFALFSVALFAQAPIPKGIYQAKVKQIDGKTAMTVVKITADKFVDGQKVGSVNIGNGCSFDLLFVKSDLNGSFALKEQAVSGANETCQKTGETTLRLNNQGSLEWARKVGDQSTKGILRNLKAGTKPSAGN